MKTLLLNPRGRTGRFVSLSRRRKVRRTRRVLTNSRRRMRRTRRPAFSRVLVNPRSRRRRFRGRRAAALSVRQPMVIMRSSRRRRSRFSAGPRMTRRRFRRGVRSTSFARIVPMGIEGLLSKPILMTAGGAVAAVAAANFAANLVPSTVPTTYAKYGTAILIPVAGAYLFRKKPDLARGFLIGGASMLMNALLDTVKTHLAAATSTTPTVGDFPRDGYMIPGRNQFGLYFDAYSGAQVPVYKNNQGALVTAGGDPVEIVNPAATVPTLPLFTSPAAFPNT